MKNYQEFPPPGTKVFCRNCEHVYDGDDYAPYICMFTMERVAGGGTCDLAARTRGE